MILHAWMTKKKREKSSLDGQLGTVKKLFYFCFMVVAEMDNVFCPDLGALWERPKVMLFACIAWCMLHFGPHGQLGTVKGSP